MKPLSERLKNFSASQFIDWLCLACVDVREVHTPYDAQEEINKIREAVTERLLTLEDKLRIKQNHIKLRDTYIEELEQRAEATEACTNSLTSAQEALKSAGIEADTVQAGVMELKAQRDALAAENAEIKSMLEPKEISDEIQDLFNDTVKLSSDSDGYHDWSWVDNPEEVIIAVMNAMPKPETPATDACLNAVRAEGVVMFISELSELFRSLKPGSKPWQAVKGIAMRAALFADQLRAGNAGKDGSHE